MTTPAYQLNRAGMLIGETVADESPREPGVLHVPAGCTLIAPPAEWAEDKWPRFNGMTWDLVNKPPPATDDDPVAKLQEFLSKNPDVAALINKGGV